MDFRRGNKRSDAATTLDQSFPFEGGQRVARSHQADLMHLCEVTYGIDGIARTQMAGFNTLPDTALNSLVRGQAVVFLRWHATPELPRTASRAPGWDPDSYQDYVPPLRQARKNAPRSNQRPAVL